MSDTQISDSTPHNVADLCMLFSRLERQLNSAQQRIKRLEEAGDDLMEEDCIYTRRKTWKKAKEAKP